MPGRKHSPEQIFRKLYRAGVEGATVKQVCRSLGVTKQTK
jgi:AcrR family transcriptional regulator